MEWDDAEVLKKLESLEKRDGKALARKALRVAAKFQKQNEQSNSPNATGREAASIFIRAGKRQSTKVSMIVGTDREALGVTNGFYPAFVEYGHKRGKRQVVTGKGKLRQAFMGAKDIAKQIIMETLRKLLAEYTGNENESE